MGLSIPLGTAVCEQGLEIFQIIQLHKFHWGFEQIRFPHFFLHIHVQQRQARYGISEEPPPTDTLAHNCVQKGPNFKTFSSAP